MIQKGSFLKVIDNSGAREVCCIHVYGGYRKRYANTGDVILVSIKSLKNKKGGGEVKVKKGDVVKGLIVKTKISGATYSGESSFFSENGVLLINNQNKFIGNRIFSAIENKFRYTKYLKVLSMSSGIIR